MKRGRRFCWKQTNVAGPFSPSAAWPRRNSLCPKPVLQRADPAEAAKGVMACPLAPRSASREARFLRRSLQKRRSCRGHGLSHARLPCPAPRGRDRYRAADKTPKGAWSERSGDRARCPPLRASALLLPIPVPGMVRLQRYDLVRSSQSVGRPAVRWRKSWETVCDRKTCVAGVLMRRSPPSTRMWAMPGNRASSTGWRALGL